MTNALPLVISPTFVVSRRRGVIMAVVAMLCIQLGAAWSTRLFDDIGVLGTAWLRLAWASLLLAVLVRPWRLRMTGQAWRSCALLGLVTAGMMILFLNSVARLPLGTASALEFLGPLGVAVLLGRRSMRAWAGLAALGVVLLTQPWAGSVDPIGVGFALGAGACWGTYIVVTQQVADQVTGLDGIAVSMPVAALVTTVVVGALDAPTLLAGMSWRVFFLGLALAVILPLVPYALDLLALRHLSTPAFGTLMALEPAVAALVGVVVLSQIPGALTWIGIACVVAAGVGASAQGHRGTLTDLDAPTHAPG